MKMICCALAAVLLSTAAGAQTKKYQIAPGLSATVNHAAGSRTVQVLLPGVETIVLDLSQPVAETYQIRTADYNFDGQRDFALVAVNQANGTQVYDIFLYNTEDQSFEVLEVPAGVCERFGNVRLNPATRTLRSSCKSGGKSSTDVFKWSGPFSLELANSVDNSIETRQEAAELKAEEKAEKAERRKETREELLDRRKEKREERKEEREEEDDE